MDNYPGTLDYSITLSDILVQNMPYYSEFANSICGFVFNAFPSLKYVNGISVDLIKYLGSTNVTCKNIDNKIDFATLAGYGISNEWNLPINDIPNQNGNAANYIGYYSHQNQDKIVIYGFFDENGYIKHIQGSLSDPVTLYIDDSNWVYNDVIIDPETQLPVIIERTTQFPVISGCRIDALPIRNDCSGSIVQKYFDFSQIHPEITIGDIPLAFLANGTWYWDSPGVWPRIIQ